MNTNNKEFEFQELEDVDEFDDQTANEDIDQPLSQIQDLQEMDQASNTSFRSIRQIEQQLNSGVYDSNQQKHQKPQMNKNSNHQSQVSFNNSIQIPHRDKKLMIGAQFLNDTSSQGDCQSQSQQQQLQQNDSQAFLYNMPYTVKNQQLNGQNYNQGIYDQLQPYPLPNNIVYPQQQQYQQQQLQPVQCDCLEKLRLKVEAELDKLRGEFRRKEVELIAPLLNKYMQIEQKIEGMKSYLNTRVSDYEKGMIVQEQTIELIINSLQSLTTSNNNNPLLTVQSSNNDSFLQKQQQQQQVKQQYTEESEKEYNYPLQQQQQQQQQYLMVSNVNPTRIHAITEDVDGENFDKRKSTAANKNLSQDFSLRLDSKEGLSGKKYNEIDAEESRIYNSNQIDKSSSQSEEDNYSDSVPSGNLSQSMKASSRMNSEEQDIKSNNQISQNQSLLSPSNNQAYNRKGNSSDSFKHKRLSAMRTNINTHLKNEAVGPKLIKQVNQIQSQRGYNTNQGVRDSYEFKQHLCFSPINQQMMHQTYLDQSLNENGKNVRGDPIQRQYSPLKFYATSPYINNQLQNMDWNPLDDSSNHKQNQFEMPRQSKDYLSDDQQYPSNQRQQEQRYSPMANHNQDIYFQQEKEKLELQQLKQQFEQSLMKNEYQQQQQQHLEYPLQQPLSNLDFAQQRILQFNQSLNVLPNYSSMPRNEDLNRQQQKLESNEHNDQQYMSMPILKDKTYNGSTRAARAIR